MPDMTDTTDVLAGGPGPEPAGDVTAAGGPEGSNAAARETVSRAELDKVIRERQAAKQRARSAETELAELRGRLEALETEGATPPGGQTPPPGAMPACGHAGAGSDGDGLIGDDMAASGQGTQLEPSASADAELRQRLAAREAQLAGLLRDQRLRAAAASAGAVNPDQVVVLLRGSVRMVEREDGQFAPTFLDDAGRPAVDEAGTPLDADRFVQAYLTRPENANLVRACTVGGSGARLAGSAGPADGLSHTLADFNALPPSRRRQAALRLSRQQREALLGLGGADRAGYL